jgi:hypothetical protein
MNERTILINRAPVLTLWASVVAERLGFDRDEALSLGKAVAGLTAQQSKGRRLGIYKPVPKEIKKARAQKRGEEFRVEICGRPVPAINTADGVRAVNKNKPVEPEAAERYLKSKFGDGLGAARKAMRNLAKAFQPAQLAEKSFRMYEMFRPSVPEGVPGWGVMGKLDLDYIRSLASKSKSIA